MKKMFEVKADNNGWAFIKQLKESLNTNDYKVTLRGRHSNRRSVLGDKFVKRDEGFYNSPNDIPISKAERIAIYITKKKPAVRVTAVQTNKITHGGANK